jgi:ABC-type Fe3+-hydroxamate transport system substrate-binding protein
MKYRGDLTVSNLRKLQAAAMALALAALLGGCAFAFPPAGPASTPTPELMVLTDSRGQEVRVPSEVRRIVSLAPSNTEILFAMGLGDTVVGVTSLCDYPEEAQEIEKVGDLMEMNVEKVVALTPDLVLGTEGIPEVVEERPKVYYELDATDPAKPYTAGPGTWHDQFIRLAGGVNVAGEVDMRWVQFSTEEIISQDPDIIVLGDANWGVTADDVAQRPGWNVIAAVREGDIYPIDDNLISRPGPRLVEGLEALARIIHPELAR